MRTNCLLSLICLTFFNVNLLLAADRIVQHNGPIGTYGSISAAITAAADGDNIVINNRQDALPWTENLTIDKSLTFVSAVDNIQWLLNGTVTIVTAESRVITIVGMKNTGSILKSGAVPVNRTKLNITYSEIPGSITLVSGVDLFLGSSKAGNLTFSYGKIIGNELISLICNTDASASNDVNLIIGNRIGTGTMATNGVEINTTSHEVNLSNNLIRGNFYGVYINSLKSGASVSSITNCVIITYSISSGATALLTAQTAGNLNVDNSMLCGNITTGSNGSCGVKTMNNGGTLTNYTYNMFYNAPGGSGCSILSSVQGNINSITAEADNIDLTTGLSIAGTGYVNAGSPMNSFLDLDLTRNDIGIYGGSYSVNNFMPFVNNTESSRVIYVNTPRVVNQGTTMSVQAIGYDK